MQFFNERRERVRLTRPLSRPGGEGRIFEIEGSAMVAKIYHQPPPSEKVQKLRHQVQITQPELRRVTSWPTNLLFDSGNPNVLRGIVIPRVPGKEIHKLYSPADRNAEFPSAGWDFLIHVAMNSAAAFETIHQQGAIMADVNEGNLLVKENDGTVGLIDCDSYQIQNGSGIFLCDVGIPMWTPPELQGRDFRGLQRTTNHDLFGLAVIIFRLLFMGRHPFAGVPTGTEQYPVEDAIKKFLFAFSSKTWSRGIKPPPFALQLSALPNRVRNLFERAFLPGSDRPGVRPTGREWAQELKALQSSLKKGCIDPGHKYWNGLTACPWCEIAHTGGPNFFISVSVHFGSANLNADFTAFWAIIERVLNGGLMREQAGMPVVGSATPRPMPFSKPQPFTLSSPVMPAKPLIEKPILPPPELPERPQKTEPEAIRKMPMGQNESLGRICGLGTCFFGVLLVLAFQMDLSAVKQGAVWAFVACAILTIAKASRAQRERHIRREADRKQRQAARERSEEDYARRVAEHEAKVEEITRQHAAMAAQAEAEYQREWHKQDQEYQRQYNVFLQAQRQYEAARTKHEEEMKQWTAECEARRTNEEVARQQVGIAFENLKVLLAGYRAQVQSQIPSLELARQRFEKSKADEIADMRKLHQKRQEVQLQQYLEKQLIHSSNIPNIGSARKATLTAYGIGSAWDIKPGISIPGFGYTLLNYLFAWRTDCERQFRYNPNQPLPPAEVNAIKMRHAQIRQSALMELRTGASKLENVEKQTRDAVNRTKIQLLDWAREHSQAVADLGVCS